MNQSFRRGRSRAHSRAVLGGFCASLVALACGGGSDAGSAAPPVEPTPVAPAPDDVAVELPATPVVAAPDNAGPAEPAAPVPDGPDAPPAAEPEPQVCDGAISFDDVYTNVENDLRAEDGDAAFLRYISLSNRINQGICPEHLASDRFALIKAINSLSTELRLTPPEPIDEDETLYRIDLRDYGWDQPTTVDGVAFDDKWARARVVEQPGRPGARCSAHRQPAA